MGGVFAISLLPKCGRGVQEVALEPHIVNVILQALRGLWVYVAWGNGLGVLMVGMVMGFKFKALSQLLPPSLVRRHHCNEYLLLFVLHNP